MTEWQVTAGALTKTLWDVAIVGGGPSGAIAALHLARSGQRVVVLERALYPREKVCGDALIPDAIRALDRAGLLGAVESRAAETSTLQVFSPSMIGMTLSMRALTIKRIELDAILAEAAVEAGAVVAQGQVERVDAGKVAQLVIRGLQEPLTAKVAIIATGAETRLLSPLGMLSRAEPSVIAVRRYIRSNAKLEHLVFSFDRTIAPGYAWLFPLRDGEFNVGCGMAYRHHRINLSETLDRFLYKFEPLREVAENITHVTPLRGAVLRCGLTGAVALRPPNVLAIGESLGATFPLTGEGIGKAMDTGELAACIVLRSLAAGDLSILASFPSALDSLRARYRGYEIAERWVATPWLADLVIRLGRRSSYAASCAAAVLNETADPREVFSISALLKMLYS